MACLLKKQPNLRPMTYAVSTQLIFNSGVPATQKIGDLNYKHPTGHVLSFLVVTRAF